MKVILAMLVFCFVSLAADAQNVIYPEVKYHSWIYLKNDPRPFRGVILDANDSTIQFIVEHQLLKKNVVAPFTSESVPISAIDKIKVWKRGAVGRGMLRGALAGFLAGGLTGLIDGDDEGAWFFSTAEEKALLFGTFLAIPGFFTGAILGSMKKTFHIKGNQSLYFNARNELKEYALIRD